MNSADNRLLIYFQFETKVVMCITITVFHRHGSGRTELLGLSFNFMLHLFINVT